MAKSESKKSVEILLVSAEMTGVPEKGLPISRNLVTVDLIWPKSGTARKSASRDTTFRRGKVDFTSEPWAKRVLFRDEIDGHCGVAVSVTEPVSAQKLRKWAKLTAKAILKEGADVVDSMIAGYGDIAAAPIDALAVMVGESSSPKSIAQGVIDYEDLPEPGEEKTITIPLFRPKILKKQIGAVTLSVRG